MRQDLLLPGGDFEPTELADCKLWLRADPGNITLGTGANVTQWNDLSGNGNHATQVDGSDCPQFSASEAALGNRPAVSFLTADWLAANGVASSLTGQDAPYTIFTVISLDGTGGANQALWSAGKIASNTQYDYSYVEMSGTHGRRSRQDDSSTPTGAFSFSGVYANPTISVDWFDGGAGGTKNTTQHIGTTGTEKTQAYDVGTITITRFTIGALGRSSNANYLDGDIGEQIVFARALTDAQINLVGNYLAARYGLGWTDLT